MIRVEPGGDILLLARDLIRHRSETVRCTVVFLPPVVS